MVAGRWRHGQLGGPGCGAQGRQGRGARKAEVRVRARDRAAPGQKTEGLRRDTVRSCFHQCEAVIYNVEPNLRLWAHSCRLPRLSKASGRWRPGDPYWRRALLPMQSAAQGRTIASSMFSPSLSSPCHGFQVFVKVELRVTAVGSSLKEDDAGPGCHSNDPASDSIPGGCRRALKQTLAVAGARIPGEGVSGFLGTEPLTPQQSRPAPP